MSTVSSERINPIKNPGLAKTVGESAQAEGSIGDSLHLFIKPQSRQDIKEIVGAEKVYQNSASFHAHRSVVVLCNRIGVFLLLTQVPIEDCQLDREQDKKSHTSQKSATFFLFLEISFRCSLCSLNPFLVEVSQYQEKQLTHTTLRKQKLGNEKICGITTSIINNIKDRPLIINLMNVRFP
jgi:hypothetical protein